MYLFVDTETTGLLNNDLPLDHTSQPHVVQLAAWLGADDENDPEHLQHVASLNTVVRPRGWEIGAAATRIHGITNEYALSFGEELATVMDKFYDLLYQADEQMGLGRLIAHNLSFDNRMLLRSALACNRDVTAIGILRPFCTMRSLTDRMKLPGKRPGRYKWPSLDEAYQFCFNQPVPGDRHQRHSAMEDCLACKDIWEHGRSQGWWQ